ncbi:MAG: hypothetical protein R3D66_04210 [Alphaproteobacteria bacterium]
MAGPLTGIGGQQQIPLATPFKPGENGDGQPKKTGEGLTGTSGTSSAANTQEARANTRAESPLQQQQKSALSHDRTRHTDNADQTERPRGSLVDIEV